MNVKELIASELVRLGIKDVFGMPGDGEGLLEECFSSPQLSVYPANDQRLGLAMASGYSLAKKSLACYLVTQGPALANIAMPLLEAKSQCLPLLIIGEGVSTALKGSLAFQEFDSMSFMSPLTKWIYRVESVERLQWALDQAVQMALNGKPGPVYVEIPVNLLSMDIDSSMSVLPIQEEKHFAPVSFIPSEVKVKYLSELINKFEKIVIIAGAGCLMSDARTELTDFAEMIGAAVLCTASGRGSIVEDSKNYLGLSGLYLSPLVKPLLEDADMFIFIGSQCEETAMMNISEFLCKKVICAVNVAAEDLVRNFPHINCGIVGDAKLTLKALIPNVRAKHNIDWHNKIMEVKKDCFADAENQFQIFDNYPVFHLCKSLVQVSKKQKFNLVFENGINEMWLYIYPFLVSSNINYFCPGEHTGLGIAYGNALGLSVATQDPSIVVTGDGAFYFSISSLSVAAELKKGFTAIVLNNESLGWPKYHQCRRGISCGVDFRFAPNLRTLAEAYNARYFKPLSFAELSENVAASIEGSRKSQVSLIELDIKSKEYYPRSVLDLYSGEV